MDSLIINPIALFKDEFHCSLIDESVSTGGIKHSHYSNDPLLANKIIHAECSGETTCKLSLKSNSCPKKTNLNEAQVE
jgi:hypothetical protein